MIFIDDDCEISFVKRLLETRDFITLSYNNDKMIFAIDLKTVITTSNDLLKDYIFSSSLIKVLLKTDKSISNSISIDKIIAPYLMEQLNQELNLNSKYNSLNSKYNSKYNSLPIILWKYLLKVNIFDLNRVSYLDYLSHFNSILVEHGPLSYDDLINKVYNTNNLDKRLDKHLDKHLALQGLLSLSVFKVDNNLIYLK